MAIVPGSLLPFPHDELSRRQARLRSELRDRGVDAMLVFAQESHYWLTGYDTGGFVFFQCALVTADDRPIVLLTRRPDLLQARQTSTIEDIRIWWDADDANPADDLKATLATRRQIDRRYRRAVQIVFQHPDASLNPRQRIGRILSRPLKIYGLASKAKLPARIRALLEKVRLPPDYAERYPHQLSGGEKQRVAIARAFAAEPDLVICDEITAALDVSVQASVAHLLMDLQRDTSTACLFITHDLNLVRQLAHRIAVMQHGRLVDQFDRADTDAPDRHPYTRALLAAVPAPADHASPVSARKDLP